MKDLKKLQIDSKRPAASHWLGRESEEHIAQMVTCWHPHIVEAARIKLSSWNRKHSGTPILERGAEAAGGAMLLAPRHPLLLLILPRAKKRGRSRRRPVEAPRTDPLLAAFTERGKE